MICCSFLHVCILTIIYVSSNLLEAIFKAEYEHSEGTDSVEAIVKHLLSLLSSDVPAAVKTSYQYFFLLYSYTQQVSMNNTTVLIYLLDKIIVYILWS